MNDVIILLWIKAGVIGAETTEVFRQSFAVDYLVNDCSLFINGFDSLASDPVPDEILHMRLDTELPNLQADNRILYYTPRSTPYVNNLTDLDYRFVNELGTSGQPQAALQILSETFSGYMIPLEASPNLVSATGSNKLTLMGFQLFRFNEETGSYQIRANYTFNESSRATWQVRFKGVLRLVNTSNAQDTFALSLVSLDRLAGVILNKCHNEPAISTVRTFEDLVKSIMSIDLEKQVQNGHITGRDNVSMSTTSLMFWNRKSLLSEYNYREFTK